MKFAKLFCAATTLVLLTFRAAAVNTETIEAENAEAVPASKSAETFFFATRSGDRYVYASEDSGSGFNSFSLNEKADAGEFLRADGKRFPVKKIK